MKTEKKAVLNNIQQQVLNILRANDGLSLRQVDDYVIELRDVLGDVIEGKDMVDTYVTLWALKGEGVAVYDRFESGKLIWRANNHESPL